MFFVISAKAEIQVLNGIACGAHAGFAGSLRSSPHRALATSPGAEKRAGGSNTGSLEYPP